MDTITKAEALEWQAAVGSRTFHVIDTSKPGWLTASGARKSSGPRALCGRYPQRNADGAWLSWPADDEREAKGLAHQYLVTRCPDCLDALDPTTNES